jgi:hypothetical protein
VTFPLSPAPRSHSLDDEMDAMTAIGRALEGLSDPDVRQRVLRWAVERYSQSTQPAGVARTTHDATLDPEDLNDLFDDERERPHQALEFVASKKPA